MLLERTLRRNPGFIAAAVELHQRGAIPAGTYLIDLDAVADNAALLAAEARRHGLRTYLMTKSYGRHPLATRVALAQGLDSTVVVEAREAYLLERHGLPVGHVGHLGAIPLSEADRIAVMRPELVTVYTVEAAAATSRAAARQGRVQDLYLRVNEPGDEIFRGFVGGWTFDGCVDAAAAILELPGVRIAGLTTYPCISYAQTDLAALAPTSSFRTMLRAKERLEEKLGLEGLRVNAPANNSCATFALLAAAGATDVEPGHALLGGSLLHALNDLAERPAHLYVSEISHRWGGELYVLGGGMLYVEKFGGAQAAPARFLVGSTYDQAVARVTTVRDYGHVDYYAVCDDVADARPGDTAVAALHPQDFVNRAYVSAVSGIAAGAPKVEATFDWACNAIDDRFCIDTPETS